MTMLWRKLWGDARSLARQAIALMVLIALGVGLFVDLYTAYQNLTSTYDGIYASTRFADASVLFRAGPESLVEKAGTIPGVTEAMGRAVGDGAIIQRGRYRERVLGRFVGCPRGRRPAINDLLIVQGRYLAAGDEAVLEHQFARDNGYAIGDRIKCVYELQEREFTISGFASSPEYIYAIPSKHQLFVSRGTFGVLFIDEDQARQWLGLGRQITEVHCLTEPGREREVLAKLEGMADSYGIETAYVQDEQPSKHLLALDQQGFAQMSVFFPILFLGSAALSLYGALSRIVRLQVTVIGTLRALGFGGRAILIQHVAQGVLVAVAGAVPGAVAGHFLGVAHTELYAGELRIPVVIAPVRWDTIATGLMLALVTGLVASYLPARMAAGLHPAVAMRGDVEGVRGLMAQQRLVRLTEWARIAYRIPVRGIFRRASRTVFAVAGIAGGASIMVTTLGIYVSTMDAIDEAVSRSRRYEIDVQLTHPDGFAFARSIAALPDGEAVSPTVSLPVRLTSSWGAGEIILTGLERGQTLLGVRSVSGQLIDVEPGAIWLPKQLGRRLLVEPGDPVRVEWVRSSRDYPVRTTMRVAGLFDVALGGAAYGEVADVRRSFADKIYPHSGYGAFVRCDPERTTSIKRRLERSDEVALVSTTADIEKEIDEQMGLMFAFIGILLSFGSVLAGAAIHSVATVSLLERTRELATLRTLGFSAREAGGLAGAELGVLAVIGLAVGLPFGAALNTLFIASFTTENMAFRPILPWWVHVVTVSIVVGLVAFSSYSGMRHLRGMDLAQATKAQE